MKKKKLLVFIFLVIILLIIFTLLLRISIINKNSSQDNLEYIYSEEIKEGTTSPDMIHVVIALYKGEVDPRSISKSTYYFINTVVPNYLKKCTNDKKTEKFFKKNLDNIKMDVNTNKSEFKGLISEIRKLSGELEYESSRFDSDTIRRTNKGLEAMLYIKYKNNPEISVKVTILNEPDLNKSPIKYTK